MKQKAILVISLFAGLAAFWLTTRYLRAERRKYQVRVEMADVVVAAADLPAGTLLRREDLGVIAVPRSQVTSLTVTSEDRLEVFNKRLLHPMRRLDVLTWPMVDVPERIRAGLAPAIQSGMRAVSLSIGGDAAVSGLVEPNNRVDILGTFSFPARHNPALMETVTLTVLQDVTVLATGQRLARGDGGATEGRLFGYSSVTFLVTPREAELLVFAQHARGQLTLALRNPEDMSFEPSMPAVNFEYLQRSLPDLNAYRQREILQKR